MDIEHMERLRWLKPTLRWVFSTAEGDYLVQLPRRDLTDIGHNSSLLFFTPAPKDMSAAPPTRRRGTPMRNQAHAASSSRRAAPTDEHRSTPSRYQTTPAPPPPALANLDPFQEYVVQSFHALWAAISRCTCMSPHAPRSPSAPGPSRRATDTEDSDSDPSEA